MTKRIVLVDLLRGVSILLVLAVHFAFGRGVLHSSGFLEVNSAAPRWVAFASTGAYGVSIFFVLSGYLITGILLKPGRSFDLIPLKEFYVRRAGRILPLLFLVCAIASALRALSTPVVFARFCLAGPIGDASFWGSIATFTFNWYRIVYDHAPRALGLVWSVLWSLSIEEQFYLAYPLALKWLKSVERTIVFLLLIFAAGPAWRWLAFRWRPDDELLSLIASFGAFDQIAAGCLLYFACRRIERSGKRNPRLALFVAAAGAGMILWVLCRTRLFLPQDRIYGPSLLAVGVCLFLGGGLRFEIPENFATAAMCLPGRLSYGTYLLHPLVLFLSARWVAASDPWIAFALFVLINVGVALPCHYLYEKPLNGLIRRKFAPDGR